MSFCHAAIYARVSSEHQAEGGTVASQIAALEARLAQTGSRLRQSIASSMMVTAAPP